MRPRSPAASHWTLDPDVVFLNHGSFGACPKPVLAAQSRWRERMEAEPVRFFVREWQAALDHTRERLAAFLSADAEGLVFVRNATEGVNAALRSHLFAPGDQILTINHIYNACRNAVAEVARASGAEVITAQIPFPLTHEQEAIDAVVRALHPKTKLLLIDHVTSPTGLVLPIEPILRACQVRGIATLVDGAHAPGMIPLDLGQLGATWYTGNCHKWMCAPKGAAFLWTDPAWRAKTRPVIISHGTNMPTDQRSRYHLEFDWPGTHDASAILAIPTAIDFMAGLDPQGWTGVRHANRNKVLQARDVLAQRLGITPPAPDEMIGSLAALPLPDGPANPPAALYTDPLQDRLWTEDRIEVPISPWPKAPKRLIRVSAQLHNHSSDYLILADALLCKLA